MRIKRLDITGFKSFMERSVFTFDDGITGVVGPNGCGKSNVVDALRWVMGEQSAKNLRGRGMEDVIFAGSESHSPLSMAEVSLTLSVEDRDQLPEPYKAYPEVTVTRRLFRNGDSEYLINRTLCRLLDVTELFLGTGVGTKAYSIIEQGRVGLIVSSKPEDRRHLIEEAAGITKYKSRRKAAERKMEHTRNNLLRVRDVVGELGKRLESLSRQAKKAERHRTLTAELREIELHRASHRFLELLAERRVMSERLEQLSAEESAGLARLEALESKIALEREALAAEAEALNAVVAELHEAESEEKLASQALEHGQREGTEAEARLEAANREREALELRRDELERRLQEREQELASLSDQSDEGEQSLASAQSRLEEALGAQREAGESLEVERAALVELTTRLANRESALNGLSSRREELHGRRGRLEEEAVRLREETGRLDESRERMAGQVAQSRQLTRDLSERRGHEEDVLTRTRAAFAESEVHVIAAREELSDKRSRLSSLQEIQRSYEGFDRGVRAVMSRAGGEPRAEGIFGLVAELVRTEPEHEPAVEAVLGERLQHVIVESSDKAFELASYLESTAEGRGSFVPRDVFSAVGGDDEASELSPSELARQGVVAPLRSLVRPDDPELSHLVDQLLRGVVLVEDVASARAFMGAGGPRRTVVTRNGEVIRPDGTVVGGALEGAAVGALQQKREIAELAEDVAHAEERYNERVTRHYSLQKQLGRTEELLKGLSKNQHAEELNLAGQEKDLHQVGADLARLRGRLEELEREREELGRTIEGIGSEEEELQNEVAHGQADRQAREERVAALRERQDQARAEADEASQRLTVLKVEVAAHGERRASLRKELEQLSVHRLEAEERLNRLGEGHAQERTRMEAARAEVERATNAARIAAERKARLSEALETRREAHQQAASGLKEEEEALKEVRGELETVTQALSEVSMRERERVLAEGHLLDQVRTRHQTELLDELHRFHTLAALPEARTKQLDDLRRELDKLGSVNLSAIEEHAEIAGRHEFLSRQQADLESSLAQLQEAISRIDRTSRDRFKQTFDVVNERFQKVFPRLFGGGRATLVLTPPQNGQEHGVEIVAQPPGKKLQSVGLLSGGEKALTAVSLIFAIFLIKPTPFCVLDEVDAPLDEGNVGRYNEMVAEMSQGSQFILITHNKRTMETVDSLYGVTMEEPGVSKLVSVRLREAANAANDDTQVA